MKRLSLILVFFSICALVTAQFDDVFEYGHYKTKQAIGYWTCRNYDSIHLIDYSNNLNHSTLYGCKHVPGRKNRVFFDSNSNRSIIDSTGALRMCLDLNSGYSKVGGICMNCDLISKNNRIRDFTISFWAKRDYNSYGNLLDIGSDQTDYRLVVYNSQSKSDNNDSIHLLLLEKGNAILNIALQFPINDWNLYVVRYDSTSSVLSFNRTVNLIHGDEALTKKFDMNSFNFGYAASMFLGKSKYDSAAFNKGLKIDDIGIWAEWIPISSLTDFGLHQENSQFVQISVFPNPANHILFLQSPQIITHYQLIDILGNIISEADGSQIKWEVPLPDISVGLYSIKIVTVSGVVERKIFINQSQ